MADSQNVSSPHIPEGYCACIHPGPDHNPAWTGDDVVYPCDNCACLDFRLPPNEARERAEQVAEMERTGWPEVPWTLADDPDWNPHDAW